MTAPETGMVLAAGKGMRLRPLTEHTPKPIIQVAGRTLLDRAIDRLEETGVKTVVVNVHHLGTMIEDHLAKRPTPAICISREDVLLETGGGVAKALSLLGPKPFFVCNSDTIWLNGPTNALGRLTAAWDPGRMDALLLIHQTVDAYGYSGTGDFICSPEGRLVRRPEREVTPYLFTGVQILSPQLFEDVPEGPFSLNVVYDRAIARGRLFGVVHDGEWFHIGNADGLKEAEAFLSVRYAGRMRR
ncbi:MAG: nucleotidyltransferase family protein [Rhodospirillales bacterium]|nr:nucleotidyltransferase family protein [Rhodospirillales bacterium]